MSCFRLTAALILTTLVLGTSAYSEDNDTTEFRVDSYRPDKFTDFEWKLDGGMNLRRDESDSDRDYHSGSSRNDYLASEYNTSTGNLDFESAWRYRYETSQVLWDLNFYLDLDYSAFATNDESQSLDTLGNTKFARRESGWQDYAAGAGFAGDGRWFVKSDLFFSWMLAWDYRNSDRHTRRAEETEWFTYDSSENADRSTLARSEQDGHSQTRTLMLNGELLIGWGRVYQGEYAATALFIIDELKQRGLLKVPPSKQHLFEFSRLVHASRLQYRNDEREHRALVLESLLTFLSKRGYVESGQAAALIVAEDVWDYYPVEDRRFGSSIRFGFGGQDDYLNADGHEDSISYRLYTLEYRDSTGQVDSSYESYSHAVTSNSDDHFMTDDYFILRFEHYKPLSLRWHWELHFDVLWHLNKPFELDDPEDGLKFYFHNWREVSIATELRYLHDARTELRVLAMLGSEWKEDVRVIPVRDRDDNSWEWLNTRTESRFLFANLQVQFTYRISVPTQLNLVWSHYRNSEDQWFEDMKRSNQSHGFSLKAGLTHWLF